MNKIIFILSLNLLKVSGILIEEELKTGRNINVTGQKGYDLLPSLDKCGLANRHVRIKRIVGGKPIPSAKYPWMVQLYLLNVSIDNNTLNCGGTLITESVVLTGAHCLSRITAGASMVEVAFGNNDRRKVVMCPWDRGLKKNCSRRHTRGIKESLIHENYSEGNLQNDIGLIILDKPVKFTSKVRPICLPYSEELLQNWDDTKVQVMGWGLLNKFDSDQPRKLSDVALEVDLRIRERKYCDHFHTRQYGTLKGDRFCSGGEAGRGSCSGDSGGPLSKKLSVPLLNGKERVFQIGIVSSGTPGSCGYEGRPLINTNVLFHVPWILRKLRSMRKTINSVESFSAELSQGSHNSEIVIDDNITSYKNEISTGLAIDVLSHPNLSKLPSGGNCGSIPKPKPPRRKSEASEEEMLEDEDNEEVVLHRTKRLVGGTVAGVGWFPFMAQIYVRDALTAVTEFRCAGTIISPWAILTAAHCVTEIPTPFALDSVVVGNSNRNKTTECIGRDCFSAKSIPIMTIIIHEEYTKFTHEKNIAIIKLSEELKFNRFVQPICLPTTEPAVEGLKDMKMISAGWGRLSREKDPEKPRVSSNVAQYLQVNLRPREDCDRVYTRLMGNLDRSRLCGGGNFAGRGECAGDGGGPLMKSITGPGQDGKIVQKYIQFGITSYNECGQQGMPTVYSNILFHMPFILEHL